MYGATFAQLDAEGIATTRGSNCFRCASDIQRGHRSQHRPGRHEAVAIDTVQSSYAAVSGYVCTASATASNKQARSRFDAATSISGVMATDPLSAVGRAATKEGR
jgi:hypothetical protein